MTTNFDPTTMPESIFVHEVTDYWHNGMIKYSYQCDENWNGSQHEYTRSDLCVPRDDVMELVKALEDAQKTLAMMIAPDAIKQTTVLNAYAAAVEAEYKVRQALANFKQKYGETNE